jgi:CDP-glycerol glycerophosphotransferase (TagB/SpsB family)
MKECEMNKITEDALDALAGKYLDGGETEADLVELVDACDEAVQNDRDVITAFYRKMQGVDTAEDRALLDRVKMGV